jgi:signal transduction histidine kinase
MNDAAPPPTRRTLALDILLAAALTALVQVEVWFPGEVDETFARPALSSPLLFVVTASLAWRRRAPVGIAALSGAGLAAQTVISGTWTSAPGLLFSILAVTYALGAYATGRRRALGVAALATGLAIRDIAGSPDVYRSETDVWNGAFLYAVTLMVFGAGALVASRRRARLADQRALALEQEREEAARLAVADERARIARELHDIVAHDVSAALIQTEAAEELLDSEPERARTSLRTAQRASRDALKEMRSLVRVLRGENERSALEPLPGISELPSLVARARNAGLDIGLLVERSWTPLPPGVDASVYRIVQESLTNVRKHAGSARAHVVIRYTADALEVEVTDNGAGSATSGVAGYGLVGMRERVVFFGGDFEAGPREPHGFVVRARFPLPEAGR